MREKLNRFDWGREKERRSPKDQAVRISKKKGETRTVENFYEKIETRVPETRRKIEKRHTLVNRKTHSLKTQR